MKSLFWAAGIVVVIFIVYLIILQNTFYAGVE
jgi:preprotein translocase subunit SecG